MKRYIWAAVFLLSVIFLAPCSSVSADMGPKPSVTVTFEGMEQAPYYVTLLSEEESTGPWSKGGEFGTGYGHRDIWKKFNEYKDSNGFYFIGNFDECSKDNTFVWGYYPPSVFKILLYFPKEDKFIVSADTYERYAFDSYFTVSMNDMEQAKGVIEKTSITATYQLSNELVGMVCRMIATVLIEVIIAWFFGYRKKQQIGILILTNLATQGVLNIFLNVVRSRYFLIECVIVVVEALIYEKLLLKYEENKGAKHKVWMYALTANACSFFIGVAISMVFPAMF